MRGEGLHGHVVMVVSPVRYAAEYSPIAYIWEAILQEGPVFPQNLAAGVARTLENEWSGRSHVFREQVGCHTALKHQLFRVYLPEYWTGLIQPGAGIATVTLLFDYR